MPVVIPACIAGVTRRLECTRLKFVRVAIDSNVLLYAKGLNGLERRRAAEVVLRQMVGSVFLAPLVLGKFYNVLVRKARCTRSHARERVWHWRESFGLLQTPAEAMLAAVDLASDHEIGIWDAAILAAADFGRCSVLLSEDFQDGFRWRGVTVVNPFAMPLHPALANLL